MESPKLTEVLHIRVHDELVERLQQKARKARRKLSDYIRFVLEDHADTDQKSD